MKQIINQVAQGFISLIDKLEDLDEQYHHACIFKESELVYLFNYYKIEPFNTFGESNKGLLKRRITGLKKEAREQMRALSQQLISVLEDG